MKVFKVMSDKDGTTTKIPGTVSTDIVRVERFYACDNIGQAFNHYFKDDVSVQHEIEDLVGILEVISNLQII